MGLSTTYTKTETDFLIQQRITTAYLGIATTTTTPPATGAYWYRVDTAGTYTNFKDSSNTAIEVTAADLAGNLVHLEVKDNVAKKSLVAFPSATSVVEEGSTLPINSVAFLDAIKTKSFVFENSSPNLFDPYSGTENLLVGFPNETNSGYYTSPLIPYDNNTRIIGSWIQSVEFFNAEKQRITAGVYSAVSDPIPIDKLNADTVFVRFSVPINKRYEAQAYYGSYQDFENKRGAKYFEVPVEKQDGTPVAFPYKEFPTIEAFQKEQRVGTATVGNILVKSTKQNHKPIYNKHTQLDYEILNYEKLKPNGAIPIETRQYYGTEFRLSWISKDGRVFGFKNNNTDANLPLMFNSIEDFIAGNYISLQGNYVAKQGLVAVRELDNGELLLVEQQDSGGTLKGIYRSINFKNYPTEPVNWVKVLTYINDDNKMTEHWGISIRGRHIMISEYAMPRTKNSGVWYSEDYGATFTMVATTKSLNTYAGNTSDFGQHIHGVCYDPYWNRLWVMLGEGWRAGTYVVAYSDDKGATWTRIGTEAVLKTLVGGGVNSMKFCGSYAFKSGIIMGTDSQPNGLWRYNRTTRFEQDFSQTINLEEAKRFDLQVTDDPIENYSGHERTITHILGMTIPMHNGQGYLVNVTFVGEHPFVFGHDRSSLIYYTQDGVQFTEIYREEDTVTFPTKGDFMDDHFKSFALKDGRVVVFSNGNPRFHAQGKSTLMIGRMPCLL